jgi:hypothetical protein
VRKSEEGEREKGRGGTEEWKVNRRQGKEGGGEGHEEGRGYEVDRERVR